MREGEMERWKEGGELLCIITEFSLYQNRDLL